MGYQSKTWSLSDEVVAAIDRAKDERGESPNQYLKRLLKMERTMLATGSYIAESQTAAPPARELLVELDGDDNA